MEATMEARWFEKMLREYGHELCSWAVDAHIFYCLFHYAPELLLLGVLALVAFAGVMMRRSSDQ